SRSSSTRTLINTSGRRRTTVSSPMSSRFRPTWRCRSRPRCKRSFPPANAPGSTRSPPAISRLTSCISRAAIVSSNSRSRGSARAFVELGGQGGGAVTPAEAYERAKQAAAKALALDSGLGEACCMLAFLKFVCDFDWAGAEAEFKHALDLSPSSADTYDLYGRMLSALSRHDEAVAMVKRAQELDPLAHRTDVASMLVRAGRYDEAMQAATRAVEFDPDDPRGRSILGWA